MNVTNHVKGFKLKKLILPFFLAALVIGAPLAAALRHTALDALLREHVFSGQVDYVGLGARRQALAAYLDRAAHIEREEFASWTQEDRLAFLINLYNAWTLRLILEHEPVKSIRDIEGAWDKPLVRLFGETMSLNALEHEVIRKDFQEPRVHFALVCAAKSCPPLRSEAYEGPRLAKQLDEQTRAFLADPTANKIDLKKKTVTLSPLFKWYVADFGGIEQSALKWVARFRPPEEKALLESGSAKVRYSDYDWALNGRR